MRPSVEKVVLAERVADARRARPCRSVGLELGRLEASRSPSRSPPCAPACRAARPRAPRRRRSARAPCSDANSASIRSVAFCVSEPGISNSSRSEPPIVPTRTIRTTMMPIQLKMTRQGCVAQRAPSARARPSRVAREPRGGRWATRRCRPSLARARRLRCPRGRSCPTSSRLTAESPASVRAVAVVGNTAGTWRGCEVPVPPGYGQHPKERPRGTGHRRRPGSLTGLEAASSSAAFAPVAARDRGQGR